MIAAGNLVWRAVGEKVCDMLDSEENKIRQGLAEFFGVGGY